MIVEVHHTVMYPSTHVATVDAPETDINAALEYAYRWTQNIHDSWSRGFQDRSDHVTVVAPLPVYDGVTYGHRSSMVGDTFKIGDRSWVVASVGFTELTRA